MVLEYDAVFGRKTQPLGAGKVNARVMLVRADVLGRNVKRTAPVDAEPRKAARRAEQRRMRGDAEGNPPPPDFVEENAGVGLEADLAVVPALHIREPFLRAAAGAHLLGKPEAHRIHQRAVKIENKRFFGKQRVLCHPILPFRPKGMIPKTTGAVNRYAKQFAFRFIFSRHCRRKARNKFFFCTMYGQKIQKIRNLY